MRKKNLILIGVVYLVTLLVYNTVIFKQWKYTKSIKEKKMDTIEKKIEIIKYVEKKSNLTAPPKCEKIPPKIVEIKAKEIIIEKHPAYNIVYNVEKDHLYRDYVCPPLSKNVNSHLHFSYYTQQLFEKWDQVAKKYNITYFIYHNSLLASYRERGFPIVDHPDNEIKVHSSSLRIFNKLTKKTEKSIEKGKVPEDGYFQVTNVGPLNPHHDEYNSFEAKFTISPPDDRPRGMPWKLDIADFDFIDNKLSIGNIYLSVSKDDIYPLKTCYYSNLYLPCPRHEFVGLQAIYGKNFLTSMYYCDPETKEWVKRFNRNKAGYKGEKNKNRYWEYY